MKFWKPAYKFEKKTVKTWRKYSIKFLRISLGIVFLWFGILKLLGVSPVEFMIKKTYDFVPFSPLIIVLGIWESLIGLGLILHIFIRTTLFLLWIFVLGVFTSIFFHPELFFNGNPLYLTLEGEFMLKNLIILAASIVIAGYKIPVGPGGKTEI
jgi:putative oxidoreductase